MIVPFMYFFRSLSNKLRTIFLTLIFALYFPSYAICRRKKEPKIFGFKNLMERGIRKCLTSVIRQISSKKNYNQALVISKRLKFPQGDRTGTNFTAPPRMHFQSSKSPLDSLKSVFNVFRTKTSTVSKMNSLVTTFTDSQRERGFNQHVIVYYCKSATRLSS